jgi:hypothetical protein
MRDGDYNQAIYPSEVIGIARVERKPIRQGNRSDHCVVSPRVRLSARASQRRSNLAECASSLNIEWKGIEVGFRLLEMRKASGSFGLVGRYEGSNR